MYKRWSILLMILHILLCCTITEENARFFMQTVTLETVTQMLYQPSIHYHSHKEEGWLCHARVSTPMIIFRQQVLTMT
ncbi:unnamed protein product [Cuscuta campestris]|uniref:Secreted protein n=1 Tax=Cuscuta campestris TaxID=132261 RepID=A0A484MEV0_9ASTE|nr:unnamed protein product [Cuscuta campestris]